jgi:hypothetical protein
MMLSAIGQTAAKTMPPMATSFCPVPSPIHPHATACETIRVTAAAIWATVMSGVANCPAGGVGVSVVLDNGGAVLAGGFGVGGNTVSFLVSEAEDGDDSEDADLDDEDPGLGVRHGCSFPYSHLPMTMPARIRQTTMTITATPDTPYSGGLSGCLIFG